MHVSNTHARGVSAPEVLAPAAFAVPWNPGHRPPGLPVGTARQVAGAPTPAWDDLGGIALPPYQKGLRRFTMDQWHAISIAGQPYGACGAVLLEAARQRLQLASGELQGIRPGHPENDLAARFMNPLGVVMTREGGNHLVTWLTQVESNIPFQAHTRENAIHAITRSWVPFRAAWHNLVDALADCRIYTDAQHASDRLADLPRGHGFLQRIWRYDHKLDLSVYPGFRSEQLRDERRADIWRTRVDQWREAEDNRVTGFFERRAAFVADARLILGDWLAAGGSAHPPVLLRVLCDGQADRGRICSVRRPFRSDAEYSLTDSGAGYFAGHGISGLLRAIAIDGLPYAARNASRDQDLIQLIRGLHHGYNQNATESPLKPSSDPSEAHP